MEEKILSEKKGASHCLNLCDLDNSCCASFQSTKSESQLSSRSLTPNSDKAKKIDFERALETKFPSLLKNSGSNRGRRRPLSGKAERSSSNRPMISESGVLKEELEENESDKEKKISKLKMPKDIDEFHLSKSQSNVIKRGCESSMNRCKSVDRLPKVDEDKTEDEPNMSRHNKFIFFRDKNEFNVDKKQANLPAITEKRRNSSVQIANLSELTIEEDFEKEGVLEKNIGLASGLFSGNSSNLSSPRFRLKVDEIDMDKRKKFFDESENEVIEEERLENEILNKELLEMARSKLNEEKEKLKKIIKSEFIDIQDNIRSKLDKEYCPAYTSEIIQETQENAANEDGNYN